MAGGLLALLDDVAAIARLAAASLDDVAAAAGRAGAKTAAVVVDDAAVTPGYVVGLSPDRELPIIGRIALGSVRNKLLFIGPVALLLSALAPWALGPVLMLGGLYLCFEGAEKVIGALRGHAHAAEAVPAGDPAELERQRIAGAVRTDLILSAEIMVIALAQVEAEPLVTRAVVLALVGVAVTVAVYGVVGALVKMDDLGLRLVAMGGRAAAPGRLMVRAMPAVLGALSAVGTAAMLWVGGGILLHGAAGFGWSAPEAAIHHLAARAGLGVGALEWLVGAGGAAAVGIVAGGLVAAAMHLRPGAARGH